MDNVCIIAGRTAIVIKMTAMRGNSAIQFSFRRRWSAAGRPPSAMGDGNFREEGSFASCRAELAFGTGMQILISEQVTRGGESPSSAVRLVYRPSAK